MTSDQAEALGFPNPILGLIGFSAVIVVGVALLDGAKFSKWFWRLFNLGTLAGFLFNHYLIYQSLYNIGSLCLWCMLVWTVTWPIFLFTTIYAVENKHWRPKGVLKTLLDFVRENSIGILFAWYVIIIGLILNNFWYYWETIIPLI